MILPITLYPSAILMRPATPVMEFNKKLREIVANMFETMYANEGMGLAAPQVGVSARIMVMNTSENEKSPHARIMINPMILVKSPEMKVGEEGCLSLPGELYTVVRHLNIKVRYQNEEGKFSEETLSGLRAVVVQHESDHLSGILISSIGERKLF